ncbi:hypothetical protein KJ953_03350 [Patescibacteria group bacterium]|nr:hypothetical protein [Patescibacteria group bacterium]
MSLADIYKPGEKLGGTSATFATLLNPLIVNILIISALAAFLTIIISGFNYITASGDKAKVEQSARMLNYALLGLAIIASAYLITRIVGSIVDIDLFNP